MALADRQWRGFPARAARVPMATALLRVLLLSGLALAGWLLGGVAAAVAEDPARLSESADSAERTGLAGLADSVVLSGSAHSAGSAESADSARVVPSTEPAEPAGSAEPIGTTGATGPAREATATPTGSPVRLGPVGDRVGRIVSAARPGEFLPAVAEAGAATGHGARQVVGTAADTTGGVVSGTVEAGRRVGDYAGDSLGGSPLTQAVSEGLAGSTGGLRDGLQHVVDDGSRSALPVLGGPLGAIGGLPAPDHHAPAEEGDDAAREGDRDDDAADGDGERAAEQVLNPAVTMAGHADALAQRAAHGQAAAGRHHDAPAAPWQGGSDSAGAVSSSSVPVPATAGFLMNRSDVLRLTAQRVALPGDPTLVVRDAADDPSFSPD